MPHANTRTTQDVAADRLHNAVVKFAQQVSMDLNDILHALRTTGQDDIADSLDEVYREWQDAGQRYIDSLKR